MTRAYLTTTIPYVNAAPHLGFALEAVQADVLARHRRRRGDAVRLLSGTDDNSLKNVLAAEAEGVAVGDLVDRNASAFEALRGPLNLSYDDFIRTSRDPRHRTGVEALWRACAAAGDLYRRTYTGWYCVGCEHYLTDSARCPEHDAAPIEVSEENWFFRLSRYAEPLHQAIHSGRLRIEPASRRNEVLAFIAGGLRDFSVSRSTDRARGWGIAVPDDPGQVVYVWWDALGNYVTALGYGGADTAAVRDWWTGDGRRIHLLGKGVLRFHAVYWPAMLLSAGLALPTDLYVHDYLTVEGHKISKSAGTTVDPVELAGRYGTDAVRWWLLREVPRVGDADFTVARLVARSDDDLSSGAGNLVNRVVTMVHKYRAGRVPRVAPEEPADDPIGDLTDDAIGRAVDEALQGFDFRAATAAVWTIVADANRRIEAVRPWTLAGAELDGILAELVGRCRRLGVELAPFLPDAAARITAQCTVDATGLLPAPRPLFPRLSARWPAGGTMIA